MFPIPLQESSPFHEPLAFGPDRMFALRLSVPRPTRPVDPHGFFSVKFRYEPGHGERSACLAIVAGAGEQFARYYAVGTPHRITSDPSTPLVLLLRGTLLLALRGETGVSKRGRHRRGLVYGADFGPT